MAEQTARLVAIGDVHGNFDAFRQIVRGLDLVDDRLIWKAKDTTLVQIGDVCDRGEESRRIYELLMSWQAEAGRYGSALHFILGNHEVMEMFGFDRDASLDEIQGYAESPDSPGYMEHHTAFSPGGWLYEWLLKQTGMVQIGPIVFGHGDLPMAFQNRTVQEIHEEIMNDVRTHSKNRTVTAVDLPDSLFSEDASLIWCRQSRESEPYSWAIKSFLRLNRAALFVCGHTPSVEGRFTARNDGRYLCIDTAMGFENRGIGRRTALVVEEGRAWEWIFARDRVDRRRLSVRLDPM
ncbi:metallophosphoesterase [Salinispira pacifica]